MFKNIQMMLLLIFYWLLQRYKLNKYKRIRMEPAEKQIYVEAEEKYSEARL